MTRVYMILAGHKVQILLDLKMDLSHLDKLKNGLMKKMYEDDHKKVACSSHCLKIPPNVAFEVFDLGIFFQIFVLLKVTCLVTLFDCKL